MRGSTTRQVTFLSVTTDQLVAADHPIRRAKPFVEAALAELSPVFDQMYAPGGPALDPARALAQGLPLDRLLFDSQRAPVLRAAPARSPLQVVPGPQHRGPRFRPEHLRQEPRPALEARRQPTLLRGRAQPGSSAALALQPALHRRRHPARVLGLAQEPQAAPPQPGRPAQAQARL